MVDDELYIAHTTAILRYLARHHGTHSQSDSLTSISLLVGFAYGDEKLDLQVEMYGEQIQDYIMALMPWATVMLGFGPETVTLFDYFAYAANGTSCAYLNLRSNDLNQVNSKREEQINAPRDLWFQIGSRS